MRLKDVLVEVAATVLGVPEGSYTVSIFQDQKRLMITPTDLMDSTDDIQYLIDTLSKNFLIDSITQDKNSVIIVMDPRQDFDTVKEFMSTLPADM